jgi:NNP family nitrate/nitrite transporter-like MFS transporter
MVAGLSGVLPASVVILAVFRVAVSFGTADVVAVVPLLFPYRPAIAAGFLGGVSTAGASSLPSVTPGCRTVHLGYAVVALTVFVPIIGFYFWSMRHESNLSAHGIGTRSRWLGTDGSVATGGDD